MFVCVLSPYLFIEIGGEFSCPLSFYSAIFLGPIPSLFHQLSLYARWLLSFFQVACQLVPMLWIWSYYIPFFCDLFFLSKGTKSLYRRRLIIFSEVIEVTGVVWNNWTHGSNHKIVTCLISWYLFLNAEVITSAEFHPTHCNTLAYSSSKGSIRLIDLRQSALCDSHSKL